MIELFGFNKIKEQSKKVIESFEKDNSDEKKVEDKECNVIFSKMLLFIFLYSIIIIWPIKIALKLTFEKSNDVKVLHIFLSLMSPILYILISIGFL